MTSNENALQIGNGKAAGAGAWGSLALIIVWFWNSFMPAHLMPVEVGMALGTVFSTFGAYITPHDALTKPRQ